MTANEPQQAAPLLLVYKLTEGYVLDYGAYTVALTSPVDLAKRVQEVAEQSEVGFQSHEPELVPTPQKMPGQSLTPELIEATAVPTVSSPRLPGVVPTNQLEGEWGNVRKMIAFFAGGYDTNGHVFGRKEWDAALSHFAPHVDPKEAEFALGEFLESMHPDD